MLKFYFTTVVIWWVILYASIQLTIEKIIENGWIKVPGNTAIVNRGPWYLYCLFIAVVPIIRAAVAMSSWYMFFVKGEPHGDF